MAEFDREALVAATTAEQSNNGNLAFWGAVIALPLIGVAVGAFFMTSGNQPAAPYDIAEQEAPSQNVQVATAEAEPQSLGEEILADAQVQAGMRAPVAGASWSASAEMGRYTIVRRSLMACAKVGSFDVKMHNNFAKKNSEAFEKLQAIKSAEWKAGRSDRRKKMIQANNQMMVGLVTGETQMKALEMSAEFQNMQREMENMSGQPRVRKTDPQVLALLGGEPDLAKCSKLKIEVQRGKHDISFEKRS